MINFHRKRPGLVLTLLITGQFLLLAGCGDQVISTNNPDHGRPTSTLIPTRKPTAEPSLTPRPVPDMNGITFTIYVIASEDEPYTGVSQVIRNGLEDFVDFKNSHGGVNGAALELLFVEVDDSAGGALSAFESAATNEDALVYLIAAPVNQELYDLINQGEAPVLYFGIGAESLKFSEQDDHLFWLVPTPEQQLGFWLEYALKNWKTLRPEGQFDVMRLTHLSWENQEEDLGRMPGLRELVEEKNIVLASGGRVDPSANASAANSILDGVFNQSTMIYMDLFSYGPALVQNDLAYLDLGGMFNLAGGSWSLGINLEPFIPNPAGCPAIFSPLPIAWWSETDNPGIQAAGRIFRTGGRESSEKELAYLYALSGMDLAAAGIQAALVDQQDAAQVELSPGDVYQALSELEEYQVLGGLYTIDFSKGNRTPAELRVWKLIPGEGMVLESEYLPVDGGD